MKSAKNAVGLKLFASNYSPAGLWKPRTAEPATADRDAVGDDDADSGIELAALAKEPREDVALRVVGKAKF